MHGRKTHAVALWRHKINTQPKSDIIEELQDAPLSSREFEFLMCVLNRLSEKELSERFCRSISLISKWKRALFERLQRYELNKLQS